MLRVRGGYFIFKGCTGGNEGEKGLFAPGQTRGVVGHDVGREGLEEPDEAIHKGHVGLVSKRKISELD